MRIKSSAEILTSLEGLARLVSCDQRGARVTDAECLASASNDAPPNHHLAQVLGRRCFRLPCRWPGDVCDVAVACSLDGLEMCVTLQSPAP